MKIAILEDDPLQNELYKIWLATADHSVKGFETGKAFIEAIQREQFDLLIIDWMLPDINGDKVLEWVREHLGWEIPVVFITTRSSEAEIVRALKLGADDYVTKPAKCFELLARIDALARRSKTNTARSATFGIYQVDYASRQIFLDGKPADLTQKEFDLTVYMFQHPNRLLSRVHLLEKVWDKNPDIDTRTIDTHISRIRKKLNLDPEHGWKLIPVYGYGYRLEKIDVLDSE